MYRSEKRIPTILALVLLFFTIGIVVYFDQSLHLFTSSAKSDPLPYEVHFTNITDSSFTVSWTTETQAIGSVIVSDETHSITLLDDLDVDNIPRVRTTHYITVKNLKEDTLYSIKIISGDHRCPKKNLCPVFTQKTSKQTSQKTSLPPLYGTILNRSGNLSKAAIVYLTIAKSLPLSTRTDSSGLWVISFNNLRQHDLLNRKEDIKDNDLAQITAQTTTGQTSTAVIDIKSIKQNLRLPPIQIGNSYNFINLASKKPLLVKLNNQSGQNILGSQTKTKRTINILFPLKDGDVTKDNDNRPTLRGVGPPGKKILIIINSNSQTAQIIVDKDGTWSFRPEKKLSPGTHYITVQGYDETGKLLTVKRKFIVLKSGEGFVLGEEATPSATLTPTTVQTATTPTTTPSILPTLTLTLTPTTMPSITLTPTSNYPTQIPPVTPPRAGITSSTFVILGGSISLLALAAKLLLSL